MRKDRVSMLTGAALGLALAQPAVAQDGAPATTLDGQWHFAASRHGSRGGRTGWASAWISST
jgi:hypothetical protein